MNNVLKKLLLALIASLLGVMSGGAMAITYYDFNFTGDNGSVVGVFGVNESSSITSITGTVSGRDFYNGPITGLVPIGEYASNDNNYSTSQPFLSIYGVAFSTSGGNLGLINDNGPTSYILFSSSAPDSNGSMTSSLCTSNCTSAAPEIDGAMMPQVGFLLGCLFLMFGRKKENAERLMTA